MAQLRAPTNIRIPRSPPPQLQAVEWEVLVVSVTGCIGAGKSTFTSCMEEGGLFAKMLHEVTGKKGRAPRIAYMQENLDDWTREVDGGPGMLEWYYQSPKTRCLPFQMFVFDQFVTGLWELLTKGAWDVIITERNFPCQELFYHIQEGRTPRKDMIYYPMYLKWSALVPKPALTVYLEPASVDQLMTRVRLRGRDGEVQHKVDDGNSLRRSPTHVHLNAETGEMEMAAAYLSPRSQMEELHPDEAADEDGPTGVTREYQQRLLQIHQDTYRREDPSVHYVDASEPFHRDRDTLVGILAPIAQHIGDLLVQADWFHDRSDRAQLLKTM